jgi:hypothetical protein
MGPPGWKWIFPDDPFLPSLTVSVLSGSQSCPVWQNLVSSNWMMVFKIGDLSDPDQASGGPETLNPVRNHPKLGNGDS